MIIKDSEVNEEFKVLHELRNQGFFITQHEDKFGNVEYHAVKQGD